MKKRINVLFILLFAILISFTLVGCGSDDSKVDKLEASFNDYKAQMEDELSSYNEKISESEERIIALEKALKESEEALEASQRTLDEISRKISEKETTIISLQEELNVVKDDKKVLKDLLDGYYAELNGKISSLEEGQSQGESSEGGDYTRNISVNLADKYYLVVGDTFQLFYRSVIQAVYPYGYYIHVTGTDGHTFNRYYEHTPTTTGTLNLTIEVCDDNGVVLGSDSTQLIVASDQKSSTKNVLVIGDSLTQSGQWVARGVSKYQKAGGTINTIGTVTSTLSSSTIGSSASVTVKHEGHGSWQWESFISGYNSSTPSPFKSSNGGISFKEYITKNSLPNIDEVYILLTFNGFTSTDVYDFDCEFIQSAKTLIDQIHTEYPAARITLFGLPLTSTYAGLGSYYSISRAYSDNYGVHVRIHQYDNFLESWCKLDEYRGFMRYVDLKGQFDSEYNMPYDTKNVNGTNSSVKENVGTSMGMHPSSNGYNQIGDAFYRALMSSWGK